jgi:hypothetical protein
MGGERDILSFTTTEECTVASSERYWCLDGLTLKALAISMSSTLNTGCFGGGSGDLDMISGGNAPSNSISADLETLAGWHVGEASGKKVAGGVISSSVAVGDSYYFCKMRHNM